MITSGRRSSSSSSFLLSSASLVILYSYTLLKPCFVTSFLQCDTASFVKWERIRSMEDEYRRGGSVAHRRLFSSSSSSPPPPIDDDLPRGGAEDDIVNGGATTNESNENIIYPDESTISNISGDDEEGETMTVAQPPPPAYKQNTDSGVIIPDGGLGSPCVIKVLGVGGGGGNAVNRMIQTSIQGVSFWAINTDSQALAKSLSPNVMNIGVKTTRGLGAGGDPNTGRRAALENQSDIKTICAGADLIFVTAGMGGGTGSGAAPVVAEVAKEECGCLTVGVVTKPFGFEGRQRMRQAEAAIEELRKVVDTLIIVSNDKLLRIVPDNTPVMEAFLVADDILRQGVVGISEIIIKSGLVNVDFADVKSVMKDAGTALMGVGSGVGKLRAQDAAVAAISSPLLDFPIKKARGIVFNVVGGKDLALSEIRAASEVIYENADSDANIIFGALVDESMEREVTITVLACDFKTDEDDEEEEDMGVGFYKERREATRGPLDADATLEDTRKYIAMGGIVKNDDEDEEAEANKEETETARQVITLKNDGKKRRGVRAFFRRLTRRG